MLICEVLLLGIFSLVIFFVQSYFYIMTVNTSTHKKFNPPRSSTVTCPSPLCTTILISLSVARDGSLADVVQIYLGTKSTLFLGVFIVLYILFSIMKLFYFPQGKRHKEARVL